MNNVLWFDLETTGLDEKHHSILSVGTRIYTGDWQLVVETHRIVRHHDICSLLWSPEALDMHRKSGLFEKLQFPAVRDDLLLIEDEIITNILGRGAPPMLLAGNSIHFDRRFIKKYMPRLDGLLHDRMIDVSSIMEAMCLFRGMDRKTVERPCAHTPLDDIDNSISRLKTCLEYNPHE